MADDKNQGDAIDYAREVRAAADELRRGAERWRLPTETTKEHAARLGTREWVYPAAEYALPHARMVVELAARLDAIADDMHA